jgi:hypothetical protein
MRAPILLPPPWQTRRSFLKRGVLGGALLALGGGGFLLSRRSKPIARPLNKPLKVLDEVELAVLSAIAARVIPARTGMPSTEDLDLAFRADLVLSQVDPNATREVKQLLKLFENALTGFLFGARVRPFTRLPEAEQDQVLQEWQTSRLMLRRTGFQALRTLITAAYFGSPEAWSATGYPGPPAGFHQPEIPAWDGRGPRPDGNGVFHEGSDD